MSRMVPRSVSNSQQSVVSQDDLAMQLQRMLRLFEGDYMVLAFFLNELRR